MERHVFAVVQLIQFVAHVFEEQSIFLWINLETALQQPQNEFNSADGDHAALVDVHDVPGVLEITNVGVGQQGVLLVGVE